MSAGCHKTFHHCSFSLQRCSFFNLSEASVQFALCLGRADQAQKALSHQEFICNLVCITNELKGATSKHLKSLQSQKNDDPKKTRNPKILRKKYAKKKQNNSL